jgi:hypothetical protein
VESFKKLIKRQLSGHVPGRAGAAGQWLLIFDLVQDKHLFHRNDLKRYSLGTKNKTLKRNADGSLTLHAGAKSPAADKESNWPPAPDGRFSLYIRAYWGKEGTLDGSWQPPRVVNADSVSRALQ